MRQIYFEKIDLHLSNIGLGTLAIGGPLWDWGWDGSGCRGRSAGREENHQNNHYDSSHSNLLWN